MRAVFHTFAPSITEERVEGEADHDQQGEPKQAMKADQIVAEAEGWLGPPVEKSVPRSCVPRTSSANHPPVTEVCRKRPKV
jgi:hypothetical protein